MDVDEVEDRHQSVGIAVRVALLVCAAGTAYAIGFATPGARGRLMVVIAITVALALVILRLPWPRIMRAGRREAVFIAWNVVGILLISAAIAVDGGVGSPLSALLFLPLLFACNSYPVPSVIALAVASAVAFVAIGVLGGASAGYVAMFTAVLMIAAVLVTWQARGHARRRLELAVASRTDHLTGALNRRGFVERAAQELAETRRSGRPLTLLLLDLDDFKRVNDTMGHEAGDELLVGVVASIRSAIRPGDAVGRLGGDEFAVLLPGLSIAGIDVVTARIDSALADRSPSSRGIACAPRDGVSVEDLMRCADQRMYARKGTKSGGRRGEKAAHAGRPLAAN